MVYFTTKREGYREYKSREYLCKTYPTRRMCTENAKCEKTVLRHAAELDKTLYGRYLECL